MRQTRLNLRPMQLNNFPTKHQCKFDGCEKTFVKYNSLDKYCPRHRFEVKKANKVQQTANKQPKKGKKIICRKPTGELKVFLEIWRERKKVSELSGKKLLYLGHPQWIFQFLHVLPKGKFPSMRLEKENIMLALPDEHSRQDTFTAFTERKEKLLNKIYNTK